MVGEAFVDLLEGEKGRNPSSCCLFIPLMLFKLIQLTLPSSDHIYLLTQDTLPNPTSE